MVYRNSQNLIAATALTLGVALPICSQDKQTLIWRGCGVSKTAFMKACAEEYAKATGVKVRLSGGGATLGIEAAASGGADLGGTCRACLPSLKEDKLDIKLAVVAWDALVVVVHEDNTVKNITSKQLRLILKQKITNWKDLGGDDAPIVVVARRGKTSGVGFSTRALILGKTDAEYGPTVIRLNSSGPVEKLVERQPNTIGVTGVSSARQRNLKILHIDGHDPSVKNISSGAYPYFRPLYVAFKPNSNPKATRFVDWLLSPAGQRVIELQQTVSLTQGAALTKQYMQFGDVNRIVNYQKLVKLAEQANR